MAHSAPPPPITKKKHPFSKKNSLKPFFTVKTPFEKGAVLLLKWSILMHWLVGTMFFKVPFWRKNSPNYSGGPQKNWPLLPFLLISPKMIHQTGPVSFILYLVNQNTSYNPSNMFKNMNSIDKNREKLQIGQFFDLFWQSSFFLPTKAHQSEFFFPHCKQWIKRLH